MFWDSLPLHGFCPRSNCQVCISQPPPATAGGSHIGGMPLALRPAIPVQLQGFPPQPPIAWILLTCSLISWIFCLVTLVTAAFARRYMLTPLTLRLFASFACRGFCILSASYLHFHALFVLLCARFLPAIPFRLGLLLLLRLCLMVTVCLQLSWCRSPCALSSCHPRPVLPGAASPSFCVSGGAEALLK
jgi:hypothetical protein